jgi:hypothetical protein
MSLLALLGFLLVPPFIVLLPDPRPLSVEDETMTAKLQYRHLRRQKGR